MIEKFFEILLIEDNPDDTQLLLEIFGEAPLANFKLTHAKTLAQAKQNLSKTSFDAVLLDLSLPGSGDGLNAFQILHQDFPDIPIVVLSGMDDETIANAAVGDGAQDYLIKGEVTNATLKRCLQYAIRRQLNQKHLRGFSVTDELTELYNLRGFLMLAKQQLKLAQRNKREMLLLFINIEDLEKINEKFGRAWREVAIKRTAEVLRSTFRDSDILCRRSEDEFLVLAIDAKRDNLEVIGARLQKNLKEVNERAGLNLKLMLNIGIYLINPQDNLKIEEMIAKAEKKTVSL